MNGGQFADLLQAPRPTLSSTGFRRPPNGSGGGRRASSGDGGHQHPRPFERRSLAADAAPIGLKPPDGDDDEAERAGELRWALTLFSDTGLCGGGGDVACEYEDFFYRACLCDRPDPVDAWRKQSDETRRLRGLDGVTGRRWRLEGPGTDLTLNVSGRTFVAAVRPAQHARRRVLHGPRSRTRSTARSRSAIPRSTEAGGRRREAALRGRQVVDATAERNEEFLLKTLDTDEGARRLGELASAQLRDRPVHEEIPAGREDRGTIHLAVGMSYPETGGKNSSRFTGHGL